MIEHASPIEFRVDSSGRRLNGPAIVYGDVSPGHREKFEPGSLVVRDDAVLNLQHDRERIIARNGQGLAIIDTPQSLNVRADLRDGSAELQLIKRGVLTGLSLEFHALQERRSNGLRVIERADVVGIGLVDKPSYPSSTIELRARSGRTLRQRIPADVAMRCECAAPECKWAKIIGPAMQEMFEEVWRDTVEVLAVRSGYAGPLASKSAGTVRAEMGDGEAIVSIDLPVGPDGDAVIRAIDDTGAVIARPYFDRDRSEYDIEEQRVEVPAGERVAVYRRAVVRSIVVGATDARDGWLRPELIATPGMGEERAAPARRREVRWWLL